MDFRNIPGAQGSRGLRNNNPMNLRPSNFTYLGQVGKDSAGHAIFSDVTFGIRAGVLELYTNYFKHGFKTLYQMISDFAPASDGNNVQAYVNFVSKKTGIPGNVDIKLSGSNIEALIKAFTEQEVGSRYAAMISNQDIVKGINAANKKGLEVASVGGGSFVIVVLVVLLVAYAKKKGR